MCGISGFFGPGTVEILHAMTAALQHRGPDDAGYFVDPDEPVYLGHRRLSVIDIAGGAQPMTSPNGSLCLVFNGEIYNHADLRRELETLGHVFQTDHSDTEVILNGYKQWGSALLQKLNGMFAFVIWDKRNRSLFMARDRFGEKPLFWACQRGLILFGSELSAILAHPSFSAQPDPTSVAKYFAHGYIPAPKSLYQDCYKVLPGQWIEFSIDDLSKVSKEFYWRFSLPSQARQISEQEALEELQYLLDAATRRRMIADVPLGLFLSGGIDSSAIAASATRAERQGDVESFAIGFNEASYDESVYARQMASALDISHHEKIFDLSQATTLLSDVLSQLDEPMADPSLLPTYMLCEFARQHITVALSGDGGDELFAGYDPFLALSPTRLYSSIIPAPLHRIFASMVERLPRSTANMSLDYKLRRALKAPMLPESMWNPTWLSPTSNDIISQLTGRDIRNEDVYDQEIAQWDSCASTNLVDRTLEYYTHFYLPNQILTKVDRASMMHSLEVRSVFLDVDVAEFAMNLPREMKLFGRNRKHILKAAMADRLPPEILHRKKKGFGIPLLSWLEHLKIDTDRDLGLGLQQDVIARAIADHEAGRADHRLLLWAYLVLEKSPVLQ